MNNDIFIYNEDIQLTDILIYSEHIHLYTMNRYIYIQ